MQCSGVLYNTLECCINVIHLTILMENTDLKAFNEAVFVAYFFVVNVEHPFKGSNLGNDK